MQSTRKGPGEAEVKAKVGPETLQFIRDNLGGAEFSAQYARLKGDADRHAKTAGNEFKSPKERQEATQNYKEALSGAIKNLDEGIAQIKGLRGNFNMSFGGDEAKLAEFDAYVANLEQTRGGLVDKLWKQAEKEMGEGTLSGRVPMPFPNGIAVEELEKKYPAYKFETLAAGFESEERELIISQRRTRGIDISVNFEGDKILKRKPRREIDEQFE